MSRFVNNHDLPPAIGQVVVMAFEQDRWDVKTLDVLDTVLIIKPDAGFQTPFYKFPGGMLRENETFACAALRELREETGVIPSQDTNNLVELCRTPKRRHSPHSGMFDIAFFAAFGCDFATLHDPLFGDVGDEAEESLRASFSDVAEIGHKWPIATSPSESGELFHPHRQLLAQALTQLAA
jgi:ADP-ribose pyrophosphatase YjhB (NUDIX family)